MKKKRRRSSASSAVKIRFDQRLVLVNWMLDLFGEGTFDGLAKNMSDPIYEGFDEEGISKFYHNMCLLFDRPSLSPELLLAYDNNIVRHWRSITANRNSQGQVLYPKYFQYLCLLFTEIYLDFWFRNPEGLLNSLNSYLHRFNSGTTDQQRVYGDFFATGLPKKEQIPQYKAEDLKKLAFWSATGSGKTLLMHINIMQYQHYLKKHGRERELNKIILLTPNEGLSLQHYGEFQLSGLDAELFIKDVPSLFSGKSVEIIDIHKLRETTGEKTVAVDSFEGNNLVLVDEGHRGASGADVGHWMGVRKKLCEQGFSFEYSATFGQAVKNNRDLAEEYAKCILFDYSYKYFYSDGYGKEYRILNLEDDSNEEHRQRYLTACLLVFYQQLKIFEDKGRDVQRFLLEKPLWVFVGGSVTKTISKRDVSDIVDILLFLAEFVTNHQQSISYINSFLLGRSGLHDKANHDLFATSFTYLGTLGLEGEAIYRDVLRLLFNTSAPAAMHVRQLKGSSSSDGEVALHIGPESEPFGVINVGDASGLCKLCENHANSLVVSESEFSGSIFHRVNQPDSEINVVIGSRKFSEGWSSWRVSTMGLMNIGRSEGAQIIQLFGRGVRLKGVDFCLKRSSHNHKLRAPEEIERLETLNIFGVRADYMQQFKAYLEEEGLPSNENRIEHCLPILKGLGGKKLKTIKLREGIDYKRQAPKPTLDAPDDSFRRNRVVIDWYPKVQAMAASGINTTIAQYATIDENHFTDAHIAFMDIDALYFDLQQMKSERAWWNFNLPKATVGKLLTDSSWYAILIPNDEMELRSFNKVNQWQEIASALLCRYCDRFYKVRKAEWEKDHLEYRELTEDDGNFIKEYNFLIDQSRQDIKVKLEEIGTSIKSGNFRNMEFPGGIALMFERHLYQPLIHVKNDLIEVKQVSLNEGERDFVLDLQKFCNENKGALKERELYLLRNMSRGRGVGFFEAGNFYPDFILWILADGHQYINFVDPKGLRNVRGSDDPKVAFHRTIKKIEADLHEQDEQITLNSFIVSNTRLPEINWWGNQMTKTDFENHHIFFQQEDKDTYVKNMFARALKMEVKM